MLAALQISFPLCMQTQKTVPKIFRSTDIIESEDRKRRYGKYMLEMSNEKRIEVIFGGGIVIS
jgi:hypothetical protein